MDSIFAEVKISFQHCALSTLGMTLDHMAGSNFEDNYLYTWTNDLNFENDATPDQDSSSNAAVPDESAPSTSNGLKRSAVWENEKESQRKKVAKTPDADENEGDHNDTTVTDAVENDMPMWSNETETMDMQSGFEGTLSVLGHNSFSINDSLLPSHNQSLAMLKQEMSTGGNDSNPFLPNDTDVESSRTENSTESQDVQEQDCRFQYVLAAGTSIASKSGDETLTYLNQGQSYGIKLKKIGDLLRFKGKLLKSIVRVQFHERRLQYIEREQILAWQASRPGERILELDVPLSYGLFDVEHDEMVNTLSFCWDPTQEVGAYIKVNSISTEFTAKKHGGEKGVPFRIQVETYIQGSQNRLHAAACQIRVFKLKGADRKHKQEREKWSKLPEVEKAKYQLPYESTILSDIPLESLPMTVFVNTNTDSLATAGFPSKTETNVVVARPQPPVNPLPSFPEPPKPNEAPANQFPQLADSSTNQNEEVSADMTRDQMSKWLIRGGFEMLASTFAHFNGADMLRLTRQDLVHMCGLPDGVRLFYAVRARPAVSMSLYVNLPGQQFYNAVYLSQCRRTEFIHKITSLININESCIADVFVVGPHNIHVQVSDEFLRNLPNESTFSVQILKENTTDRCCLLLKPTSSN